MIFFQYYNFVFNLIVSDGHIPYGSEWLAEFD